MASLTLFEFIDSLFDQRAWDKVTDNDKKTYFFNLNRFLSHKYPQEVNNTNNIVGMNRNHVPYMCDYWQRFLITKFTSKPSWFFWKTNLVGDEKGLLDKFDKDFIIKYKKTYRVNDNQLAIMAKLFPEELEKELKMYKDSTEAKSRKKPQKTVKK